MIESALDQAIELMRQAQALLDGEHPVIAAHLETVIGLAADRSAALDPGQRAAGSGAA